MKTPKSEQGTALTDAERKAIKSLERLAKTWPRTLMLFGGGGWSLSVRRIPDDGSLYGPQHEVARIYNIFNDGGDGGDER